MIRLFGHHLDIPAIVLAVTELGGGYLLVLAVANLLRANGLLSASDNATLLAVMVVSLVGLTLLAVGLYNREHSFQLDQAFARAATTLPILAVMLVMMSWLVDTVGWASPSFGEPLFYVASIGGILGLLMGVRWGFVKVIDNTELFRRRVAIIGFGPVAGKIETLCRQQRDRSFSVIGYLHLGERPASVVSEAASRRNPERRSDFWLQPSELGRFCRENRIEEIVVALEERRGLPVNDLLACRLAGVTVTEFSTFWERESRQIELEGIRPSWLLFSDGFRTGRVRLLVKRVFDILASVVLLILTLPITLLTALLIKLEDSGDIFYRQPRVGLGGKPFEILKFRSMRTGDGKASWTLPNDSRITRVGRVIRKLRIDEIPQAINVLKGEMAFVGPRPEQPEFVKKLAEKIPYYQERHSMKPGITGWAQINYPYGASDEDARNKLTYDLYYTKNANIFLDVLIMIQTVKVLLWNSGAR